eukprot:COSAG03_NODE_3375_length_2051_cov_2178.030225_1_plen_36_part_10
MCVCVCVCVCVCTGIRAGVTVEEIGLNIDVAPTIAA